MAMRAQFAIGFILFLFATPSSLMATDFVWDAGGDGVTWTQATNWDQNSGYPDDNGDTATIATGAVTITSLGTPLTIGSLTLGVGFTGRLVLDRNLTIDDGGVHDGIVTISANTTLQANGADLTAHIITVTGTLTVGSGSVTSDTVFDVNSGGSVDIDSGTLYVKRGVTLDSGGDMTMTTGTMWIGQDFPLTPAETFYDIMVVTGDFNPGTGSVTFDIPTVNGGGNFIAGLLSGSSVVEFYNLYLQSRDRAAAGASSYSAHVFVNHPTRVQVENRFVIEHYQSGAFALGLENLNGQGYTNITKEYDAGYLEVTGDLVIKGGWLDFGDVKGGSSGLFQVTGDMSVIYDSSVGSGYFYTGSSGVISLDNILVTRSYFFDASKTNESTIDTIDDGEVVIYIMGSVTIDGSDASAQFHVGKNAVTFAGTAPACVDVRSTGTEVATFQNINIQKGPASVTFLTGVSDGILVGTTTATSFNKFTVTSGSCTLDNSNIDFRTNGANGGGAQINGGSLHFRGGVDFDMLTTSGSPVFDVYDGGHVLFSDPDSTGTPNLAMTGIQTKMFNFSSASSFGGGQIASCQEASLNGANVPTDIYFDFSAMTSSATNCPIPLDFTFNGTGINVKSGASTPRMTFRKSSGNFGTIATNGENGDDDTADVIYWHSTVFLMVNTTSDVNDGTTTNVATLVANAGADGVISLREAIAAAVGTTNVTVTFDRAVFNESAQSVIQPGSVLPTISTAVTLDASQSGVTLDGSSLGASVDMLILSGTGAALKGLWLQDVPGDAISITGGLAEIGGSGNREGNVIFNTTEYGIHYTSATGGTKIRGNYIGTNRSGENGTPSDHGIYVNGAGALIIGGSLANEENYIGYHDTASKAGIHINNGAPTIQGNYIGTDSNGNNRGNAIGLVVAAGADAVIVGGTAAGESNTIARNNSYGIQHQSTYTAGSGILYYGNYIGTDSQRRLIPNGDAGIRVQSTGKVTIGAGGNAVANTFVSAAGKNAIEQTAGTIDLNHEVQVSGDISLTGGTWNLNNVILRVTGDITTSATWNDGTSSIISLDGTSVQTFSGVDEIDSLHYQGQAPYFSMLTARVDKNFIVESGVVTFPGVTVTFADGASVTIDSGIISMDSAILTTVTPGTDRFNVNILSGGDITIKQNSIINSIGLSGMVFNVGSRMGSNTSLSNGKDNFQDLTFNNLAGIGIDLTAITNDDDFPQEIDDIVFNGAGTNVAASATTPRLVITKTGAANFGTVAVDGESGDSDPSDRIAWDLTAGSVLLITSITIDGVNDVIYVTFNDELLAGHTTVSDWLIFASDGTTSLMPGMTLTQLRNQVILDPAIATGGTVFVNFIGSNLASRSGHLLAANQSGSDPTVTDPGDQQGPPGYYSVAVVTADVDGNLSSLDMAYLSGPISLPAIPDAIAFTLALTKDGTYVFAATVTDNVARTSQVRFNVTIDNVAPSAYSIHSLFVVTNDEIVSLDGLLSRDGNGQGDISLNQWHFRSGPSIVSLTQDLTSGNHLNHAMGVATFDTSGMGSGVYEFLLQVTDDNALRHSVSHLILIQGQNLVPRADAGLGGSRALADGATQLRGHESVDPEGTALSYGWGQVSGPAVNIVNANAATATFTATVAGIYEFSLVVTDAATQTSLVDSVVWIINDVESGYLAPVADSGSDQFVTLDQTVTLDASLSADFDGQPLTYQWTQVAGPAVSLDFSTLNRSHVRLALPGFYQFSLTVSNDHLRSAASVISVWCEESNSAPLAHAGPDQQSTVGQWVTLDGSSSRDANGDPMTYQWIQILGPAVTADFGIVNPTFPVALSRVYGFSLQVSDGNLISTADTVYIAVNGANTVPSAVIGDQFGHNAERYALKERIRLDGTASNDGDGDALAIVNWLQVSGPPAILETPTGLVTHFTSRVTGDYVFELYVDDGNDRSLADSVTVSIFESTAPVPIRVSDSGSPCLITRKAREIPWLFILGMIYGLFVLRLRLT